MENILILFLLFMISSYAQTCLVSNDQPIEEILSPGVPSHVLKF